MRNRSTAESVYMDHNERGDRIRERRDAHRISQSRLGALAKVSKSTVIRAEQGMAPPETMAHLEEALDKLDEITDEPEPEEHAVEYRISGNFGVSVVVKGPVANLAELEASAMRLLARVEHDSAGSD